MASGVVRAAISSVPFLPECTIDTSRTSAVRKAVKDLLEAIIKEENLDKFHSFSETLLSTLKTPLCNSKARCSSLSFPLVREKMLMEFHELRSTTLITMWNNFLADISCSNIKDLMLPQLVNQTLFVNYVKECFAVQSNLGASKPHTHSLSTDEENILQYACRFVPMRLILCFSKQPGDKAASFVECLSHMAVSGPESSFLVST